MLITDQCSWFSDPLVSLLYTYFCRHGFSNSHGHPSHHFSPYIHNHVSEQFCTKINSFEIILIKSYLETGIFQFTAFKITFSFFIISIKLRCPLFQIFFFIWIINARTDIRSKDFDMSLSVSKTILELFNFLVFHFMVKIVLHIHFLFSLFQTTLP